MIVKTLIRELCTASGAGGHVDVVSQIKGQLQGLVDEISVDKLGNVIGIRRCGKANAPLLLLEAHMDEIGFVVTHVDDGGFIHVANCGGIDRRVLAATEVLVLAEGGDLKGVFCSTPPHLSSGEDKIQSIDEFGIDVGLSSEDVKKLVHAGTRVVFRPVYREMGEHKVCIKALDDRAGCAAVIDALCQLKSESLSCDVVALFAVQEEVGGAGASVASFALKPSAAIATDVSFSVTPDAPAHKCGKFGEGPMLGIAPGLDDALTSTIKELARLHNITLQYEVMGGETGTDADGIAFSRDGIPTALLSIPQRYMHTPVEVVDVRDVQAIADLMVYMAKEGMVSC